MQPPGPAWGAMTHAVQEKRGNVNALHTKAFTAWINHSLKGDQPSVAAIGDCTKELGSGLVLIRLVEHFSRTKCPFPYKAAPANRTLCIDNVSVALKYLGQYVPNLAIAPADIVDGNTQVILGLLWRMILKWQNSLQVQRTQGEVGEQAAAAASESVVKTTKDAKAKLLEWIRSKVASYPHVRITGDFVESFDSGMALCALVHAYDPGLVAYDMLDPNRKLDNLALGMQLAEQFLGVPRMLDPGDVANADDKAMMVYLYEFPKAFLARMEHAGGELGDEAHRRAEEEEARRRRQADEDRHRAEEEERRRLEAEQRRLQVESEQRRLQMEESARRDEEARRQAAAAAAEEAERQRKAAEFERMRMFQQQAHPPQYPPAAQSQYPPAGGGVTYAPPQYAQPQVIVQPQVHTVVIREESNIGRLTVEVVNCRNLKSQDILTQSATPYIVVQVERQKERTRKEKHTLSPNFHEKFQFYVSEPYATVDVCVYDSNMLMADTFMGKVEIAVKTLKYDLPTEGWFAFQPLHQSGKAVGGEVFLRLTLRKG
jgi:hypothetical protein